MACFYGDKECTLLDNDKIKHPSEHPYKGKFDMPPASTSIGGQAAECLSAGVGETADFEQIVITSKCTQNVLARFFAWGNITGNRQYIFDAVNAENRLSVDEVPPEVCWIACFQKDRENGVCEFAAFDGEYSTGRKPDGGPDHISKCTAVQKPHATLVGITPKCETPTTKGDPTCFLQASNHENCYVWNDTPQSNAKVTWSGQCKAGLLHGQGTLEWMDADSYGQGTGPYLDGKQHGQWEIHWADGTIGTGHYVDGKKHGRWEIRGADSYETGSYVNGKRHGQWEIRWPNGVQNGPCADGKQQGQWESRWSDGTVNTVLYVDGKEHGDAESRWPDGTVDTYHFKYGELQ